MRSLSLAVCSTLLLLFATRKCAGVFRVVTPVLENDDPLHRIEHEFALFGHPTASDRSFAAPLVLTPLDGRKACSALNRTAIDLALAQSGITATGTATAATPELSIDSHDQRDPSVSVNENRNVSSDQATSAFVLMVERGECHFADKVRYAQQAGAAGAVVFNAESDDDDAELVAMTGGDLTDDVRIPALLIHRRDAMRLVELLHGSSQPTVVQLSWRAPRTADSPIDVALWFSSRSSPATRAFVPALRTITHAFDDEHDEQQLAHRRVRFLPFYDVYDANHWGCSRPPTTTTTNATIDAAASANCDTLCVYDRTFCTYDPEWNPLAGLDGADVLNEDVRQLCVAQYARNVTRGGSALLWDYVTAFDRACSAANATQASGFNATCSTAVLATLDVPLEPIATCVREQGATLLAAQVAAKHEHNIVVVPQLVVDGIVLLHYDDSNGDDVDALACPEPIALTSCKLLRSVCHALARVASTSYASAVTLPRACSAAFWDRASACNAPLERDDCGECTLRAHKHEWNRACAGCDGVPFSGLERDVCGVCGGTGSFDACGLCLDANDPQRQTAHCRVVDDPDAVRGKAQVVGVRTDQFRGVMASAFKRAVARAADVHATDVLLQSIVDDPLCSATQPCVEVFFFVPCSDAACRLDATKRLRDPSASLTVAMAMRADLGESVASGVDEPPANIERVHVHSIATSLEALDDGETAANVMETAAMTGANDAGASTTSSSSETAIVLGALCLATLVAGFVALRARDNRIRRDFQQMFAAYTPLTTLDQEDERIASIS